MKIWIIFLVRFFFGAPQILELLYENCPDNVNLVTIRSKTCSKNDIKKQKSEIPDTARENVARKQIKSTVICGPIFWTQQFDV